MTCFSVQDVESFSSVYHIWLKDSLFKNNVGFAVVYVFSPDSCSSLADRVHP